MRKDSTAAACSPDQLAGIWLAVAAVLFLFVFGRWSIPVAAWLAPLFLLRFVRTQRPLAGFLIAWAVRFAIAAIVERGIVLYPGAAYYALILVVTLLLTLPYLVDRLLAPRIPGIAATLVFPFAVTAIEYLLMFGPTGTFNSIANTQYGNLPLMQLASVTGIWGIVFLLSWFAAMVNWAWERAFAWPAVRGGIAIYAVVLAVVLFGGGMRLALFPPAAATVRVAGISPSQAAVAALQTQLPSGVLASLEAGNATDADRSTARAAFAALDGDLLSRSQQEARAGAKIVVWPESSPTGANILEEDEPALLQQAGAIARQEGMYLDIGLGVFLRATAGPHLRDEAVLFDPNGSVLWTYEKTHPAPGEQGLFVPGDGKLPVVAGPYGRLAGVICFDLDYPAEIRQAGRRSADLLLAPSDDWRAVDPAHSQAAAFRAVEDGVSLVRSTSKGLSLASDYEGRVLAASDYFAAGQQVMVAYIPEHGVRTLYATIGDLFAWLCITGLLSLTGLAVLRSSERGPVTTGLRKPA